MPSYWTTLVHKDVLTTKPRQSGREECAEKQRGLSYMNTFFPHCPLRQEDHYWPDTGAGSASLHYYAAVDTVLTKRNLSSICLSVRAESGTAMVTAAG